MARKVVTVIIDAEGRDKDKVFQITEMPATKAEKWAIRLFLAMSHAGIEIPENIRTAGMAGVAALALKSLGGISFVDAELLLDEMMSCVKIIPDPARPTIIRATIDEDFEEIATILRLRKEALNLHINFSLIADQLNSTAETDQA